MAWPLSQDYNEALQNPLTSFSDAELRQGQVVTNALGIPQPCSGNFADVYAVECAASKTKWAVKCFTREVRGLRERYSAISSYLKRANLPFAVDFQYLEQGVRIAGKWYPILKMHWVEGFTLNAFVRDNLDKPALLEGLSRIWVKMAARLREANLAHCDLQHGNVLLVPGSTASSLAVKLIDYDGMWVPALAQTPSGEVGHPAYQHPQRLRDGVYNREVDRFPLLAIHLALRALMVGGKQLWERFDTGDNMLFRQQDFEAPARSPLFAELLRMKQSEVPDLAGKLIDAARKPLEQVAHLTELVPVEAPPPPRSSGRRENAPAAPAASVFTTAALEPSSEGGGRRKPTPSKAGFGLIAAACVAGIAVVLGGVLIWAMSSKSQPDKNAPDQRQAKAKHVEPLKPPKDKNSSPPTEKRKPDDSPTPPPVKPKPEEPTPTTKPKPKPEDTPPPKPAIAAAPILDGPPGEMRRFEGHTAELNSVAFSPDGRHALSASSDGTVRLWDLTTGKEVKQLAGHQDQVLSVAFSPDGRLALTGGKDKTARVWDVKQGKELFSYQGQNDWIRSVVFSPDGKRALTASGGPGNIDCSVRLWDVANGEIIKTLQGHDKPVTSAVFTPDGRRAVSGSDDTTVRLWDLTDGREVRKYTGHKEGVYCVAVSGDGRVAASAAFDKTIRLWDLESDKELRRLDGHTDLVMSVAFTPDGRRVLSGSLDKTLRLWDRESGRERGRFEGDQAAVRCVAVSPDGRFALSGGSDKLVRLWRLPPPVEPKPEGPPAEKVREIAFLSSFSILSKKHALDWFATNGTVGAGGKFTVQGKESPHGIFLHPEDNRDAEVSYKIGRKWAMFRCGVAVPRMGDQAEEKGLGSPLTFEVHGDEVSLWTSKPIRDFGKPQWCEVNVEKVDVLRLRVRCPGSASCARAVWLEPRVLAHSDSPDPTNAVAPQVVRLPVPDEAAQKKATEDIRDIYQDDYKNAQPDDLARKLLKRGQGNQEEPGRRFVYLREARDLAAQAGDFALCFSVIDEMTKAFTVEVWPMKVAAIQNATKAARTASATKALLETSLSLFGEAIQADDYETAEQLAKAAETAARQSRVSPKAILVLAGEAKRLQKKYAEIQPAIARLGQDPKDAEANRIVGSFRCFEKDEWERGLPLLALGDTPKLKELAAKDRAAPQSPEAREAVGSGWWTLAKQHKGIAKAIVQQRACYWYGLVLPDAVEKTRERLEKGIRLHNKDYPDRAWGHLDISQATPAPGALRLTKENKGIVTHASYSGPLEITALARTEKNNIRLYAGKGACVIFNWERNPSELRVTRPDGNDRPESGSLATAAVKPLQPYLWYLLSWRLTEEGMTVSVNGRIIFSEEHKNNLAEKHPVSIHSADSDIEILSFTVRPIGKKAG